MGTLHEIGFFARLAEARRVLIAGAGGGFDVYAGLPIALSLMNEGKNVYLANLSFSHLDKDALPWLASGVAVVTPDAVGRDDYFPERSLARWLRSKELPSTVYAFRKAGVRPLSEAYTALSDHLRLDSIVLVDGGTDILMRGDEVGLGTPVEDMTSLAAVEMQKTVSTRLVTCIGFGVDAYHGVCHAHVLENIAALDRDGGYLGAFSVPRDSSEGLDFIEAVAHGQAVTPTRPSIVNGSISAAVRGQFGDVQFTERTNGSELFINPLMALYFTFDLDVLARHSLYLPLLAPTETPWQVNSVIEGFRRTVKPRPYRTIPH